MKFRQLTDWHGTLGRRAYLLWGTLLFTLKWNLDRFVLPLWRGGKTIRIEDYMGREDEGVLHVPKAGEMLYRLREAPEWARP